MQPSMDPGDTIFFNVPDLEGLASVEREFAVATADGTEEERLEALSRLLRRVREAFRMDVVFVSEFSHGRRVFRHVDSQWGDLDDVRPGASDPLEETFCQAVVEGRLPAAVRNARALAPERRPPAMQRLAVGSYLTAPIVLSDGSVFGTICCFSHGVREDLGDRQEEALKSVARLVATAVERQGLPD